MIRFIILSYLIVIDNNNYHIKYILCIYIYITSDLGLRLKKLDTWNGQQKN
jgi:hypothetical protein